MRSLYLPQYGCYLRYFVRDGTGDPILFIPGLITPALPLFFELINHPKLRDRPAVLVNYIGSGISDHIEDPSVFDHHPRAHAEVLSQIIDAEPLLSGSFHIMGHSMGGTVGIYLAQRYSDRVLSLIMSEANLFAGGGPGTRWIASFSEQEFVEQRYQQMLKGWRERGRTDQVEAHFPGLQQTSHPAAIYRAAYHLVHLDPDLFDLLSSLTCSRHFVYGSQNVPTTQEQAMPDSPMLSDLEEKSIRTHIIPDAGHMMMFHNLQAYAILIASLT